MDIPKSLFLVSKALFAFDDLASSKDNFVHRSTVIINAEIVHIQYTFSTLKRVQLFQQLVCTTGIIDKLFSDISVIGSLISLF